MIDLASGIDTLQLDAPISPADADQSVTWKSSKTSVASVSEEGLVTGLMEGTATITATSAGAATVKAVCDVKVTNLAKEIKITGSDTVTGGKVTALNAEVLPEETSDKALSWESSDTGVAVVSSATGVVLAQKTDGVKTATITASAKDGSGVSATWDVTVRPPVQATSLQYGGMDCMDQTVPIDLASGEDSAKLEVVISPGDADQAGTWYSSDQSVATVSQDGLVTGLQEGTAVITVISESDAKMKAGCTVNVAYLAKKISLTGDNVVVGGRETALQSEVLPKETTDKTIIWASSNPEIAAVSDDGVVTAQETEQTKTVTITATAADGSGVSAEWMMAVDPAVEAVSILHNGKDCTLDTLQMDLTSGADTLQLSALISPADADQTVTWRSSDESVVSVSQDGMITGHAKGMVTISATSAGGENDDGSEIRAFCQINVVCLVSKLTVTGPDTLTAGETGTYTATIVPEAAGDVQIGWTLWKLIGLHDNPQTPNEIECDGWELCPESIATAHNDTNTMGQVTVQKDITEIYFLIYQLMTHDGSNIEVCQLITVVPK